MNTHLLPFVLYTLPLLPAQTSTFVTPDAAVGVQTYRGMDLPGAPAPNISGGFYQQVDADMVGKAGKLRSMAFRRRDGHLSYGARTFTIQLSLGLPALSHEKMSNEFAKNRNGPLTIVASGKISFPARPADPRTALWGTNAQALPGPFDTRIPFKSPFLFIGRSALLWELMIQTDSSHTKGQPFMVGWSHGNSGGAMGRGCVVDKRELWSHNGISTPVYFETLENAPKNTPAFLALGDTSTRFGGLTLPLDLSFLGGRGCKLYINPILFLTIQTDSSGTATLSTNSPMLQPGMRFRSQWFLFHQSALVSSNGLESATPYIGTAGKAGAWPQSLLSNSITKGSPPPTRGALQTNLGLVTQWTR